MRLSDQGEIGEPFAQSRYFVIACVI